MSAIVIVAIPKEDDYVYKISSEKIPHLTLLFLGESDNIDRIKNLDRIISFVEHASNATLKEFTMLVDRRGVLGDESADVLFFQPHKIIREFRSNLLKNNDIRTAYDSVTQFPEWIPHLTLGYSETPAKPDTREYPGFYSVTFDRIGVWFGEYSGNEFTLKSDIVDLAMSGVGKTVVEEILEHHGVKGMKWGVRNTTSTTLGRTTAHKVEGLEHYTPEVGQAIKTVSQKMGRGYNLRIDEVVPLSEKEDQKFLGYVRIKNKGANAIHLSTDPKLKKTLAGFEKEGWFTASNGNNVESLLTHESAHALLHVRNGSGKPIGEQIRKDAWQKVADQALADGTIKKRTGFSRLTGDMYRDVAGNVSDYAKSSFFIEEIEAEMFTSYHWAKNPPKFVDTYMKEVNTAMGKPVQPFSGRKVSHA
jgi:2'-5' RNA ligase